MNLESFINYQKKLIRIKSIIGTIFLIPFFIVITIIIIPYFWDIDYYTDSYNNTFQKMLCSCFTIFFLLLPTLLVILQSILDSYTKLKHYILEKTTNARDIQILPWDSFNSKDQDHIINSLCLHLNDLKNSLDPNLKKYIDAVLNYISKSRDIIRNEVIIAQSKHFLKAIVISVVLIQEETISFILLSPDKDKTHQKLEIVYTPNTTLIPLFYSEKNITGVVNHYKEIAWRLKELGF
ncbi:MAG: hypothetical protein ABDH21_04455 [bacterium]